MSDEYTPIDLTSFDEEYASAPVEDRSEPPDGKYQVNVEKVELTRSKEKGDPMLKWQLRILGPSQQGRMLFRNNMIVTPDNIKWLKNDLALCGLLLDKLSDLPNQLERLLDVKLEVTKTLTAVQVNSETELAEAAAETVPAVENVKYQHAGYDEALAVDAAEEKSKERPFVREMGKIGRNDPCPCGSGKKYKQCHGKLT